MSEQLASYPAPSGWTVSLGFRCAGEHDVLPPSNPSEILPRIRCRFDKLGEVPADSQRDPPRQEQEQEQDSAASSLLPHGAPVDG